LKTEEMRAIRDTELAKRLEEAHRELFNLRFRLATRQLVNYRELRRVRKEIARLETIMREKELELS